MAFFEFPHTRTYDTDLGWIIKNIKSYNDTIQALNEWIETNTPRLEDLEAFKEALESGDLPEGVQAGIEAWLSTHAADVIAAIIKNVYFGLTNAGYFAAYIPASWDEFLDFDTVMDGDNPLYGHLLLKYA
jgi:hypothetical protein